MTRTKNIYFLLLVLFSLNSPSVYAQNEVKKAVKFDTTFWQEQIKDLEYDKKEKEEKKEEELIDDPVVPQGNYDGLGSIIKAFVILVGVVLILFLLAYFLGFDASKRAKDVKITKDGVLTLDEIEEDIENVDIAKQIEMALQNNNFILALRLQYLMVIQKLTLNHWIDYKKEKTNRAYLNTLRSTPLFDTFKHMTFFFEEYWYGDKKLTKDIYYQYRDDFNDFNQLLDKHSSSQNQSIDE